MRNRSQIFLILLLTAVLTAIIVSAIVWLTIEPRILTFAVGPEGSVEQKFGVRLASLLEQNRASVRVKLVSRSSNGEAVAALNRRDVDLAILRTDGPVPPLARALAVLERDFLLRIEPRGSKVENIADLRGKKIAVPGDDASNEKLIRAILDQYEINGPSLNLTTVPSASETDKLIAPGNFDTVLVFESQSRILGSRYYEDLASATPGFALGALAEAKAIARKIPGLFSETMEAGLISSNPRLPDEDAETVTREYVLVARNKIPDGQIVELVRNIFENKGDLALPELFATRIESPDIEKDAYIAAHNGVTQYVINDVKTFLDRYSDLIYLGVSVASIIGSLGFTLYASYTRNKPKHAHAFAEEFLDLADRIRTAPNEADLNSVEAELRDNLSTAIRGMKDGRVSTRGLDAFRLGYDHAREAVAERRAILRNEAISQLRPAANFASAGPDSARASGLNIP